jgi:hypothetical protein
LHHDRSEVGKSPDGSTDLVKITVRKKTERFLVQSYDNHSAHERNDEVQALVDLKLCLLPWASHGVKSDAFKETRENVNSPAVTYLRSFQKRTSVYDIITYVLP